MQVTFSHSVSEADAIESFYFKPARQLQYTAGQFIELTLPHPQPDDRGKKRWFTLSSSPTQDLLRITTRFAFKNGSSFKKALRKLNAGDEVNMSDPMGDFVLPKLIQTPLIFAAGGIGMTPFISILQWLADTGEQRPIKFVCGVRSENDIIFQDIFDNAHQHVTFVIAEPSSSWGGEHGQLSAELILGLEKPSDDTLVYLSGPEPMVEVLSHDIHKAGIPQSRLVTDYFPGYTNV